MVYTFMMATLYVKENVHARVCTFSYGTCCTIKLCGYHLCRSVCYPHSSNHAHLKVKSPIPNSDQTVSSYYIRDGLPSAAFKCNQSINQIDWWGGAGGLEWKHTIQDP